MRNPNYYCNKDFPLELKNRILKFSEEQKNSFYSMHELLCFHKNKYAIGETFILELPGNKLESITIKETIGQGGSKKAALLNNDMVIMLPNLDVDYFALIANWWPDSVTNESAMADFLNTIQVPALDRKKAYLHIPANDNPEIIYKLPVLTSTSFQQYKSKGWYVIDNKNYLSVTLPDNGWDNWGFELKGWQETIKLLLKDLWSLELNGVKIGRDSSNLVLVKNDNSNFEVRYFGFDFGGKYGSQLPPSELVRVKASAQTIEEVCKTVSHNAKQLISDIIIMMLQEKQKHVDDKIDLEKIYDFSDQVAENFSNCEFITNEILGLNSNWHEEL